LAIQVSGVAKAVAVADTYSSVTLYVKPYGDRGIDGSSVATTVFNNLAVKVLNSLTDKAPANTTVTIQPPAYVQVNMNLSVTLLPQYRQSLVSTAINSALQQLLNIDNVFFNDRIQMQEVMNTVSNITGVSRVQVNKLVRADVDLTQTVAMTATAYAIAANVAKITTNAAHTLKVGQTISVNTNITVLNGTFVITAVNTSGNDFSYALVATTATGTVTGTGNILNVGDIVCSTSEIPEAGTMTVVLTGGIVD
jgi:hypothetical protein